MPSCFPKTPRSIFGTILMRLFDTLLVVVAVAPIYCYTGVGWIGPNNIEGVPWLSFVRPRWRTRWTSCTPCSISASRGTFAYPRSPSSSGRLSSPALRCRCWSCTTDCRKAIIVILIRPRDATSVARGTRLQVGGPDYPLKLDIRIACIFVFFV